MTQAGNRLPEQKQIDHPTERVLKRGNQRDQRPVLGTERWSRAGGTTVGGLGGSALTGCCAGVELSNRRDNVGASDTETHTYSATNTHTKAKANFTLLKLHGNNAIQQV